MSVAQPFGELAILLQETLEYQRHDQAARQVLAAALGELTGLRHRASDPRFPAPYVVAVVGLTNVGKSTLMNALLGKDICPVANYPCTAVPLEFRYAEHYELTACSGPGWRGENSQRFADAPTLVARLRTLCGEAHLVRNSDITKIIASMPLTLLQGNLTLADTPGFGAAQTNGRSDLHAQRLGEYLKCVQQVMWVVRADAMPDQGQWAFYATCIRGTCDDVIVTNAEGLTPQDQQDWRDRVLPALRKPHPKLYFVSGLDVGSVAYLQARIRKLAPPAGREADLMEVLAEWAPQLGRWVREHWQAGSGGGRFWRPDAWRRFVAAVTVAKDTRLDHVRDELREVHS